MKLQKILLLFFIVIFSLFVHIISEASLEVTGLLSDQAQLSEAVQRKDVQKAQKLIEHSCVDVNHDEGNLLNIAVSQQNPSIRLVTLLVKTGVQIDHDWLHKYIRPFFIITNLRDSFHTHDFPEIKKPLLLAATSTNQSCIKVLSERGAYPLSEPEKEGLSNKSKFLLNQYEPVARQRIKLIHEWLAPQLNHTKDLEEIIRSMEISPKEEGKEYYWRVVSEIEKKQELCDSQ